MTIVVFNRIVRINARVPSVLCLPLFTGYVSIVLQAHVQKANLTLDALRNIATVKVPTSPTSAKVQLMHWLTFKPEKRGAPKPPIKAVNSDTLEVIPEIRDAQAVGTHS